MTTERDSNLKRFLVRLGFTTVAALLVLYAAKLWFLHKQSPPEPRSARTARVVSWQDADKHYGEYATVEGTIVATHNSGKACFLNFHPNYRRYFTAVIFRQAFSQFPSKPEDYYYGKKVRVTGRIKKYKGKPEIILNDPSQIQVLK